MRSLSSFLVALQFLTRIPVRFKDHPDAGATGGSLVFYPLVGMIIGAVLVPILFVSDPLPEFLRAAMVVFGWIAITGALHLDGVADTADAWVGGNCDRERALAIMKDPRCGAMGVVSLIVAIMLKFSALASLSVDDWTLIIIIPVVARSFAVLLLMSAPYARASGLGTALTQFAPRKTAIFVAATAVLLCSALTGIDGVIMVLVASLCFYLLRREFLKRFGGITGDTAGALIEIIEVAMLLTAAILKFY